MDQNYTYLVADFLDRVVDEVDSAREKFSTNKYLHAALAEEFGEVMKAILECEEKGAPTEDVQKELIQCAAMCVRLALEGDPNFPRFTKSATINEF